MVLSDNGHWHCVDTTPQPALQRVVALLDIRHHIRLECIPLQPFLLISILRYTIYPEIWFAMIRHPAQSLFLGTFPMGLATIINMIVFVCVPAWGTWAIYLVCAESLC